MNTFLSLLDAFLCALVLIAALDYLRRVRPLEKPLLAASFYMVAFGAFGSVGMLLNGDRANGFEVLLHIGIVSYAWSRRHFMFETEWSGREQREQERRRTANR